MADFITSKEKENVHDDPHINTDQIQVGNDELYIGKLIDIEMVSAERQFVLKDQSNVQDYLNHQKPCVKNSKQALLITEQIIETEIIIINEQPITENVDEAPNNLTSYEEVNNSVPIEQEIVKYPQINNDQILNSYVIQKEIFKETIILDGNPEETIFEYIEIQDKDQSNKDNLKLNPAEQFRKQHFLKRKEERKAKQKIFKKQLKTHVNNHTKQKSLVCKCCERVYKATRNLNRHNCPSGKPSECVFCFKTAEKEKQKKIFTKKHKCVVCDKFFTRSTTLRYHTEKQHNINN